MTQPLPPHIRYAIMRGTAETDFAHMGALTLPGLPGGLSIPAALLAAGGAYLAYRLMFFKKAKQAQRRRQAERRAKARYALEQAQIRARYA